MKPTGQEIQDIVGQVTELTWNYAIWWEIVNKTNRERYKDVFEAYPNFFTAVFCSMQQSILVIVARLFDERHDVLSLANLVTNLVSTDPGLSKKLNSEIAQNQNLIQTCRKLRHKVYGHRDSTLTPKQVFVQFPIKPKEFKVLLRCTHQVAAALAEVHGANKGVAVLDNFEHCENDAATELRLIIQRLQSAG